MRREADAIKEQSKRSFDKQARGYESRFAGRHAQQLYGPVIEELEGVLHGSVLDIGCGTGSLLSELQRRKLSKLAGIDLSPEMIKVARERLGESVDLRVGDSEQLPWDANTFDSVVCTDSFHHYPRPEKVLVEMNRVLRPAGTLIIAEPWWRTPIRQILNAILPILKTGDVRVYSEGEIRELLELAKFTVLEWRVIGGSGVIITAR